jgi:SHS2 domain-containing protein
MQAAGGRGTMQLERTRCPRQPSWKEVAMFETFDHTADLGLRIRAPDRDALFADAATALFSTIVADLTTVRPVERRDVRLPEDDDDYLLFDWLKALLFWFDSEHLVFGRFEVHVDGGLTAAAWGEPLDPSRHDLEHEVKAITYHGLRVELTADDWLAEFIVDI